MNTNNTLTVTKYFKGLGKVYTLDPNILRLILEGSIKEPITSKGFITTILYHFQLS